MGKDDGAQELRNVLHSVTITLYERQTFMRPINQLPLKQWMAPPHILQVSLYDQEIGAATRIIYTDVYALYIPSLGSATVEQVFDESKRIMTLLREQKGEPSFFVMDITHDKHYEEIANALLMRPIYKNSHMKTMYTIQ